MTKKNKSALPDELKAINWSSLNYVKRRLTSILEWFLSIQATLSSHSNDSFFTLEYGSGMLLMIQQGLFQDESDINEVVLHCSEIDEWASKQIATYFIWNVCSRLWRGENTPESMPNCWIHLSS